MIGKLGIITALGLLLAITAGCRSTQPDLKPPKTPEALVAPPSNANYQAYPKAAFNSDDPFRRPSSAQPSNPIMPTRGTSGMGAPGGLR